MENTVKKIKTAVWIILMLFITAMAGFAAGKNEATQGTLRVTDKKGNITGECPLKHTDVEAFISGSIVRVNVTQEFENNSKTAVEAVYIFPLPQNSAVDAMTMIVGQKIIRGDIKEKEEAKKIYEAAKNQGKVAALLDQERPNIFTQSVANIMPGEKIKIKISYVEYLPYEDGIYEFVFPMVVGPRYMPGVPTPGVPTPGVPASKQGTGWANDTTSVPDASRISPVVTPEGTRSGHDILVKVYVNAGVGIKNIKSVMHKVNVELQAGSAKAVVGLDPQDNIPNKDFILQIATSGEKVEDAVLTYNNNGEGFFSLILQPPDKPSEADISPKEMIFVIDTSGSQMGWPVEKSKETMKYCIENMNDDDTFNLIAFSNNVVKLFDRPQGNTSLNREKAMRFLATRLGSGGTEMMPAIMEALKKPEDTKRPAWERLRIVVFMTDGYVGNDMSIIDAVKKNLGNARFFSFGVGSSVNRYLLEKMAQMGKGEVEWVTLNRHGDEVAEKFQDRIGKPVLTDISVNFKGVKTEEIFPKSIPDLFSSKPVIIVGKYIEPGNGIIELTGKRNGKIIKREIKISFPQKNTENSVLATLWARKKVEYLMDQDLNGIQSGKPDKEIKGAIIALGLKYNIMTQYTSFVAVEEKIVRKNGKLVTVAVPVEMPQGVSYEGVFGEKNDKGAYAPAPSSAKKCQMAAQSVNAGYAGKSTLQMSYEADEGLGYEPAKNPDEKLDNRLKLALLMARNGKTKNINVEFKTFKIQNGVVNLAITTTYVSDSALGKLKKAGLNIKAYSKQGKIITGSVNINRINDILKLDFVDKVEPLAG